MKYVEEMQLMSRDPFLNFFTYQIGGCKLLGCDLGISCQIWSSEITICILTSYFYLFIFINFIIWVLFGLNFIIEIIVKQITRHEILSWQLNFGFGCV